MSSPVFRLHNTLSNRIEPVEPLEPGKLRFYSCGPTVYSYAHIGNFRTFLTADLIVRTAREIGLETHYVSNITDVGHLTEDDVADSGGEDRMALALSSKEGKRFANVWDLARFYANELLRDWSRLNMIEPDVRPRATEHIAQQIRTVEALIDSGHAYETDSGVYFSVDAFKDYGRLSGNISGDNLSETTRELVVDDEKRNVRDFALWKKDPKHLMQWYSPWGWGFPGWHLECSVMALEYLGEQIDIHGGGEDLIFPHHECEIAQAESYSGKQFARYWVHTRFLQVEGEKMAKSKGNFLTVHELVSDAASGGRGINPMALRLSLISGHYRKPYNFTFDTLRANLKHIERLEQSLDVARNAPSGTSDVAARITAASERLLAAMLDDLNTPEAIAALLDGIKTILTCKDGISDEDRSAAQQFLSRVDSVLGIINEEGSDSPESSEEDDEFAATIEEMLDRRQRARASRDFALADSIRNEIEEMGVEVMDSPDGAKWKRITSIQGIDAGE
ncbi:MAG: cysteine--tRNA ligase [Rhodothermales bacterium]|nr:cysteine--tRNA ligase [Rhodothermales bacterium]